MNAINNINEWMAGWIERDLFGVMEGVDQSK